MPIVNPSASPAIPGVTSLASVSLFSDVRALAAGQYPLVWVLGGTVAGDGQDGVFYWSSSSLTADDGLTVLAPNAGGTGRWIRLYSGFSLSSGASHVSTVQSGTGGLSRTVAQALAAMVRSGDFDTVAHYKTAHAALTERIGVSQLDTTVIDTGSSTNGVTFKVNGTTQFKILDNPAATNYWTVQGASSSGGPRLAAEGPDTDIHMVLCSKGAGPVIVCTGDASSFTQLEVIHTADVGNCLVVTGCTTNNAHGVQIVGAQKTSGDTAVNLGISTLGIGKVCFESNALLIGSVQVPTVANSAHVTIGPTAGLTTGTTQNGIKLTAFGNNDCTTLLSAVDVTARTAAAVFTCATAVGVIVNDAVKGAGSVITTQTGVRVSDQTNGVTNFGFRGLVSSGSNKYNLYMDGTAQNYLAGLTGVGTTPTATSALSLPAGTTGVSSLNIPHGSAPTSPVNGDMWSTTTTLNFRLNGVTKSVTLT